MSVESVYIRRRKRIVEFQLWGFKTAKDAITYANKIDWRVGKKTDAKYKYSIGSPETKLAITESWTGGTILKVHILELKEHNDGDYAYQEVKRMVNEYNSSNPTAKLELKHLEIREKPQAQSVAPAFIPSGSVIKPIGR